MYTGNRERPSECMGCKRDYKKSNVKADLPFQRIRKSYVKDSGCMAGAKWKTKVQTLGLQNQSGQVRGNSQLHAVSPCGVIPLSPCFLVMSGSLSTVWYYSLLQK